MVAVGVSGPQSRDTPTGSDIGSEAAFRKGFVIERTKDVRHERPVIDCERTVARLKAEGAKLAESLIWSCSRDRPRLLRRRAHYTRAHRRDGEETVKRVRPCSRRDNLERWKRSSRSCRSAYR